MNAGKLAVFIMLLVLVAFIVAGCATSNPPPPKVVAAVTTAEPIKIPVLMPCLTREEIPPPPPTWMAGTSGWRAELAGALDLKELDRYLVTSQSLMWRCVNGFEEGKPK